MNSQERDLLTSFLQQLAQVQASQKDAEADALIREACARQPDAAYLLVQRSMQLEHALQAVQAQAGKLQAEMDQMRSGARSGFLDTANAWGRPASPPAQFQSQPQTQPQVQAQAAPPAAAPASAWGSSMLGNVATTAAGVVAGSFLFQGIGNLMGHHNSGFGANDSHPAPVAENTVINNYYGDSAPEDAVETADNSDSGDSGDSA